MVRTYLGHRDRVLSAFGVGEKKGINLLIGSGYTMEVWWRKGISEDLTTLAKTKSPTIYHKEIEKKNFERKRKMKCCFLSVWSRNRWRMVGLQFKELSSSKVGVSSTQHNSSTHENAPHFMKLLGNDGSHLSLTLV